MPNYGPLYVLNEETEHWAAFVRFNTPTHTGVIFGPKPAGHRSIGMMCPACGGALAEGDMTVLVALGPGDSPEAQERAQASRWYNAVAVELHAACAGVPPLTEAAT